MTELPFRGNLLYSPCSARAWLLASSAACSLCQVDITSPFYVRKTEAPRWGALAAGEHKCQESELQPLMPKFVFFSLYLVHFESKSFRGAKGGIITTFVQTL